MPSVFWTHHFTPASQIVHMERFSRTAAKTTVEPGWGHGHQRQAASSAEDIDEVGDQVARIAQAVFRFDVNHRRSGWLPALFSPLGFRGGFRTLFIASASRDGYGLSVRMHGTDYRGLASRSAAAAGAGDLGLGAWSEEASLGLNLSSEVLVKELGDLLERLFGFGCACVAHKLSVRLRFIDL